MKGSVPGDEGHCKPANDPPPRISGDLKFPRRGHRGTCSQSIRSLRGTGRLFGPKVLMGTIGRMRPGPDHQACPESRWRAPNAATRAWVLRGAVIGRARLRPSRGGGARARSPLRPSSNGALMAEASVSDSVKTKGTRLRTLAAQQELRPPGPWGRASPADFHAHHHRRHAFAFPSRSPRQTRTERSRNAQSPWMRTRAVRSEATPPIRGSLLPTKGAR